MLRDVEPKTDPHDPSKQRHRDQHRQVILWKTMVTMAIMTPCPSFRASPTAARLRAMALMRRPMRSTLQMAPNSKYLLRADASHLLGAKFEMVVRQNTPEMLRQRRLLPLCLAPGRDSLRPFFKVPSRRRTSFALPTASLKTRCRRWSLSTFLPQ